MFYNILAILSNQKKSPFQMPVVNEHQINQSDPNRPGTSRSDWQLSNRYSIRSNISARKSEILSPDLMWHASDMFSCLESLGASVMKDAAPYDALGYADSNFDRVGS